MDRTSKGWIQKSVLPALCLLTAWAIIAAPWLSGQKVIPYDSAHQFYPAVAFTVEQLRNLEGPWWNPYVFAGFPQFADPQAMTFQPTMVLPMLVSPSVSLWWFDVVVFLHLLLGGLGCLRLGRSYCLGSAPQILFALTFMFGAVASSRLQHTPMIVTYAFIPWAWLSLKQLLERPTFGNALLCGGVLGLCALQLTQLTYLLGLLTLAYAIRGMVVLRDDGRDRARILFLLLAAATCLVVSAPQVVSTIAVLPETNRVELALEASQANSLRAVDLSTLLGANALGHLVGNYWGRGEITQTYLYLGCIPVLLCLAWGGLRGEWRVQAFWAWLVAAAGVAFSLGTRTPLYPFLHEHLPGLGMFRRPSDGLFFVNVAIAFLAAIALQRRLSGDKPRAVVLPVIGIVLILVVAVVAATEGSRSLDLMLVLAPTLVAWACVLWLLRGTRQVGRAPVVLVVSLVVLDLAVTQSANRMNSIDSGLYMSGLAPVEDESPAGRFAALLSERIAVPGLPERVEILGVWPVSNGGTLRKLPMSTGYNPMIYTRYSEVFGVGPDPMVSPAQRRFTEWAASYESPAFDLLGVRGIAVGPVMPAQNASFQYVERSTVLPRVLVPKHVSRHREEYPPPAEFVTTDFSDTVWLPASAVSACPDVVESGISTRVTMFKPQSIAIDYRANERGWIVVNEMYGNGWGAAVDGKDLPVFRANGVFRAVCVPAGNKRLQLSFSPLRLVSSALNSQ